MFAEKERARTFSKFSLTGAFLGMLIVKCLSNEHNVAICVPRHRQDQWMESPVDKCKLKVLMNFLKKHDMVVAGSGRCDRII